MGLVVRAVTMFVFLWLLLRALGKRELGELSAFELLLLVVLGDLVQQAITQEDNSMTGAVLAIGVIALFTLATSYVSFRWRAARGPLEGIPAVVVLDGRFVDEAIDIERVTHDEILDAARQRGIADLRDVRLGVLEPGGRFSFLLRDSEPVDEPPSSLRAT